MFIQICFTMCDKETLFKTNTFRNVGKKTLQEDVETAFTSSFLRRNEMLENSIYYGKNEFYEIIRNLGGVWNDKKERPLLTLLKLSESNNICWAVPMGNWYHRDVFAQERIKKYLNYDKSDIRSCFYHVGRTDTKSVFFISDIIPITDAFLEREYKSRYTGSIML